MLSLAPLDDSCPIEKRVFHHKESELLTRLITQASARDSFIGIHSHHEHLSGKGSEDGSEGRTRGNLSPKKKRETHPRKYGDEK